MMTNQLCASAEQGPAGLEKAVLSLPVPLKSSVLTHHFKCAHHVVSDQVGSGRGVV